MAADAPEHTVVVHVTPGEILDQRWRIETRIGQGAMGSVFRGRDLQANKIVAIKILAPEHCRKPKVVARFEREAEKMTSLRHTNIVAFHGHGRRGVLPFIVMEFLEGLTLSDVLEKNGGKIGINETIAIVKQICSGLAFLHANGLVHRDVKPQNVFLGVGGRVIILDLGVVRDQANPGLTRPGAMVGTPYYMSPEQILGVEDIDQRTDVYALAWAGLVSQSDTAPVALLGPRTIAWAAWMTPAMLAGIAIGRRSFTAVSPQRFRRRVLELLVVVAALGIARALVDLAG